MDKFCPGCGQVLAPDSRFCPECGQQVPPAPDSRPTERGETARKGDGNVLFWAAEFPLVTSRFFLRDVAKVLLLTFVVLAGVITLMMVASGQSAAEVPPLIAYFAILVGGLGLMIILVSLLVLGNRAGALYRMDEKGLAMVARSRALPLNELSQWLGVLTGDGQLWASGILARSQERVYIKWRSVHALRDYPGDGIIELEDSFHVAMRVYCPPEIYPQVIRRAKDHLSRAITARQASGRPLRSRVPAIVGWLALTLVAILLGLCWEPETNDVGFLVVLTGMFVFLSGLLPGVTRKGIGLFGLLCGLPALGHRLYHLLDSEVLNRESDFWPASFASLGCLILVAMAGYQMFRRAIPGQETVLFDDDLDEA